MAWNATGYNENDVEADVAGVVARMGGEPIARGGDNPPLLARRDGLGRIVVPRPRFASTKAKVFRRRATISISPTGVLKRRAEIQKPLASSSSAARPSAERP
jgi:hypothetical protein